MPYIKGYSCGKNAFLNKRKASDKLFCNCRSTQAMFHGLFFARTMPRNICFWMKSTATKVIATYIG